MSITRVSCTVSGTSRGAGVGNEIIAWAKAYLCAEEFGLRLLPPEWVFNRNRLAQDFGFSRIGMLRARAARELLPQVRITQELFAETAKEDYVESMRVLDADFAFSTRPRVAVVHEGMWGGYLAIRQAKAFLLKETLSAPGVAAQLRRLRLSSDDALTVAVHVRLGDFVSRNPKMGEFNQAISLAWYQAVVDSVQQQLSGERLRFLVFSDGSAEQLAPLLNQNGVEQAAGGRGALQDLAAMAACDLLVCSVSSYSLLAAFLSGRPYIWYEPQLSRGRLGLSLWGQDISQGPLSPTRRQEQTLVPGDIGRGIPVPENGRLPSWAIEGLIWEARLCRGERDLLFFGSLPFCPD